MAQSLAAWGWSLALPRNHAPAPGEVIAWLREHAIPLDTDGGVKALLSRAGQARLVALGEATHGTHELFTLRLALLQCLVRDFGFNALALEAESARIHGLQAFVLRGEGEPRQALSALGQWSWCSAEMLETLTWLRAHNASAPRDRQVTLHGVDSGAGLQGAALRDRRMAESALALIHEGRRVVLWAHNGHVSLRRCGQVQVASMGSHLKAALGDELVACGTAFDRGAFRAVDGTARVSDFSTPGAPSANVKTFTVEAAPAGTLEAALRCAELSCFGIRPARGSAPPAVEAWWRQERFSRSVGALYDGMLPALGWTRVAPSLDFDLLVFVENTTATQPLDITRSETDL